MTQPQLYIIADHQLDITNPLYCKSLLDTLPMDLEWNNYLFYVSHLSNTPPLASKPFLFQKADDRGNLWFEANGIVVKLAKNAVQLKFPIIFRAFSDYDYLRIAIYALLLKLLTACKSTEFTAYPSFWEQYPREIKNSWHQRRLTVAQKQICENCTSYKRTKLHLNYCLSQEISDVKLLAEKQYRGWCVKRLKEI